MKLRTTAKSHLGVRVFALCPRLAAPFNTAETKGSEAMALSPCADRTDAMAALLVLRVAAETL